MQSRRTEHPDPNSDLRVLPNDLHRSSAKEQGPRRLKKHCPLGKHKVELMPFKKRKEIEPWDGRRTCLGSLTVTHILSTFHGAQSMEYQLSPGLAVLTRVTLPPCCEPRCPHLQVRTVPLTVPREDLTIALFCRPHRLHDEVATCQTAVVFCLLAIYPSSLLVTGSWCSFGKIPRLYHMLNTGSTPTPPPPPGWYETLGWLWVPLSSLWL